MNRDIEKDIKIRIRISYIGVQPSCKITWHRGSGDVSSAIGERGLEKPDPEFTTGAIGAIPGTISMAVIGSIKEFVGFVDSLEHYRAEVDIEKALSKLMPNAGPIIG